MLLVQDRAEALRLAIGLRGGARHADFRQPLADAVALQTALALVLTRGLDLGGLQDPLVEARARLQQGFELPLPERGEEEA